MRKTGRDTTYLILVVILAALVRLDFLFASNWVIDSDEGIVGLMAKHIAEGRPIPIFYYGQPYMGSLEALLAAFLFKLFGISGVALKSVPLLFSLAMVPLLYKLGDLLGGRLAGRVASILWAFPPSPLVVWSAMARGGFIEIVWLGTVAMYLTVLFLRSERPTQLSVFVIGLTLGFGWWVNNQIIYFALPVGYFLFSHLLGTRRRRMERLTSFGSMGVAGFMIGSLPFWIYNFENSFASFGILGRAKGSELGDHVTGLFGTALPMLLGAKRFWHEDDIFPGATALVALLFILLLLGVLVMRGRRIIALFTFSIDKRSPVELPIVFVVTALAAFTFSSYGHLVTAPRYLLPIYVGVYLLVGYVVAVLWKLNRGLSRAVVFILLGISFCSCYLGGRALPGQPFVAFTQRAATDHSELIEWLAKNNISFIRTNYWIGYRLAFETGEQVRFKVFQEPRQVRIPEYEKLSVSLPEEKQPYVLVPSQADHVRVALSVLGYSFEEARASGYVILKEVTPRFKDVFEVDRARFGIESDTHPVDIGKAWDGDHQTRWGSAMPQHPGMHVDLVAKSPVKIRGFSYSIDHWVTDYPRGLVVTARTSGGESRTILTDAQYRALAYLEEPEWKVLFDPLEVQSLTFTQTGADTFFDWSIGEISLWE